MKTATLRNAIGANLNMVKARLDGEAASVEEWNAIVDALRHSLELAKSARVMVAPAPLPGEGEKAWLRRVGCGA